MILVFSFVIAPEALAVPQYINYQGVLRDSAGDLVTGTKSMTFNLYSDSTGGSSLWDMTSPEVTVSNGLYTVQLGPITSTDIGNGDRWLEVAVAGTALTPRLKILSVAYAITADTSAYATLSGTASSAADAQLLDGYNTGVSGLSIIPTTDATTGLLSTSVIPSTGVNVATADYATLSGTASTAATVSDGVITTAKIEDSAVTSVKIANGTIIEEDIANSAVTSAKIADATIVEGDIDNSAVTSAKILDGTIASADIKDGTIAGGDLASNIAISTTGLLTIKTLATSSTGTGFCVGTGTIPNLESTSGDISNTAVTANSIILLTIASSNAFSIAGIKVDHTDAGHFVVTTTDELANNSGNDLIFNYLVVN